MKVEASLQQIYAQFPSLKVNADKGALQAAATKVLGPKSAQQLMRALSVKSTYLAARQRAVEIAAKELQPLKQARQTIVVGGLSSGGALAAVVAARSGYQVEALESRGSYTRNMQFSTRQEAINELASIDPQLATDFLARSAGFLEGNVFTNAEGKRTESTRDLPQPGDPLGVPESGEQMLEGVPCSLVECKIMEDLIFEYLEKIPNVHINTKFALDVSGEADAEGNFKAVGKAKDGTVLDLGNPFLIIGATGGNTPIRKAVGIDQAITSPEVEIIGGIVDVGLGGKSLSRRDDYPRADGTTQRVLTMAMGSALLEKSWVLVGRRPDAKLDPVGLDPRSDAYKVAKQELVEIEFRKEAALVMEKPNEGALVHGPMEGSKPTLFTLQQRMSNKAAAGNNFIGLGDFVGTGHFTVGGGMATATTSHIERLKTMLFDLEMGVEKKTAMARYSKGAIADTMAWGRRGMKEFYPDVDKTLLNTAWVTSVNDWITGKNKDPLAAMEKMLGLNSLALPPIGTPAVAA